MNQIRTAIYECPGCSATMQITERYAGQWPEIAMQIGPYPHEPFRLVSCTRGMFVLNVSGLAAKENVSHARGQTDTPPARSP